MIETNSIPAEQQREVELRQVLAGDPGRHDIAFQLAMLMVAQSRPVPLSLEEAALRYAIRENPGRMDLVDRLVEVVVEVAVAQRAAPVPAGELAANSNQDDAMLQAARARLEAVGPAPADMPLPAHEGRWQVFAERIRTAIAQFSSVPEAVHFAQSQVNFEHRVPAGKAAARHSLCLRELRTEFPSFSDMAPIADSPLSDPETAFLCEDRVVSNISLYLSLIILRLHSLLPKPPKRILEIGGGYGGPCRAWLTGGLAPTPNCYIIVDLAESLFFADLFLRSELGAESVFYVTQTEPLSSTLLAQHKVILCPLERVSALLNCEIDVIINTGSLQEMSDDWVDFYHSLLDRLNVKWFYSLNYFGQPINHLAESYNLWAPRLSPPWTARMLKVNPPMIRMQADRNFLEALYERSNVLLTAGDVEARLQMLAERRPTLETFCEIMDVFRRSCTGAAASAALACARQHPVPPKEALWLVRWILTNKAEPVSLQERIELETYTQHLERLLASGSRGII